MNRHQASLLLDMNGLEVKQHLFMGAGAEFQEVVLSGTRIGGQLVLSGASFRHGLDMSNLQVEQGLFLREGTTCEDGAVLSGARIGGQLDMSGASFRHGLDMSNLQVEQGPFLRGTTCEGDVSLVSANVVGNLDLSGAAFEAVLDASGMTIGGDLRLDPTVYQQTRWGADSRLVLRNARVGGIQDDVSSWPAQLELDGFTYKSFGGSGNDGPANTIVRPAAWYLDWLQRDYSFSSQPYQHLAEVLRTAGTYSKANRILYAGREHERKNAEDWGRYLGLGVVSYTYGYGLGLRSFRILTWVALFTIIGAVLLWTSGVEAVKEKGLGWCLWASFDWLLPFIELNPEHVDFVTKEMKNWRLSWFYLQILLGLSIAALLTAGLTGFITTMGLSGGEPHSKS